MLMDEWRRVSAEGVFVALEVITEHVQQAEIHTIQLLTLLITISVNEFPTQQQYPITKRF